MSISTDTILDLAMYFIYFVTVIFSCYVAYITVTTQTERKRYRTKIQQEVSNQREKIITKSENSPISSTFNAAGNPLKLTFLRFQIIRWGLILTLIVYYIVLPFIQTNEINMMVITAIFSLAFFTSPGLPKGSVSLFILNELIKMRSKKKQMELFTLFDMLQAELNSLNNEQEINVYNLLKDCIPYFDYIDTAIIKYLHLWKHDPQRAKEVLAEEIGGEDAETLSNILFKIDDTTKEHAIEILSGASKIFSASYFEGGNRKNEKKNVFVNTLFFGVNLLIIVWLIVMVVSMFSELLEGTNITNHIGG